MAAAFKVKLQDGTEMGPLDMDMMRSWYQQGLINRDSQVRPSGQKRWVRLGDTVDIQDWAPAGGTSPRARADDESEAEGDELYEPAGPQNWRFYLASLMFFGLAAAAGYFMMFPDRWLPALREAPWREIALGFVVLGLMLVGGWGAMRTLVRVIVFLLTFSLFAVAAPVIMGGVQWRPIAILVAAWVMGSGLFFFLAGRALRGTSIAMCLFWIFAGAAAIGYLGFVPPGGEPARVERARAAPDAPPTLPGAGIAAPAPPVGAITQQLPLLTPRAAQIVGSRIDTPEEAFKRAYQMAATGVAALSPAEVKELRDITTATYAPLPPPQRHRLDLYMERIRGNQVTLPQEDREMSAIVRDALLKLPDPQRARLQALYEKALVAAR